MTNRYRRGMRLESKLGNSVIILVNRASGNKHWNTQKVGSKNNHKIHEGTLDKFYDKCERAKYNKEDVE